MKITLTHDDLSESMIINAIIQYAIAMSSRVSMTHANIETPDKKVNLAILFTLTRISLQSRGYNR